MQRLKLYKHILLTKNFPTWILPKVPHYCWSTAVIRLIMKTTSPIILTLGSGHQLSSNRTSTTDQIKCTPGTTATTDNSLCPLGPKYPTSPTCILAQQLHTPHHRGHEKILSMTRL